MPSSPASERPKRPWQQSVGQRQTESRPCPKPLACREVPKGFFNFPMEGRTDKHKGLSTLTNSRQGELCSSASRDYYEESGDPMVSVEQSSLSAESAPATE